MEKIILSESTMVSVKRFHTKEQNNNNINLKEFEPSLRGIVHITETPANAQACWTLKCEATITKDYIPRLTVMNCGGSSRLVDPRTTSLLSFDVSLCATRS